jgi:hypothetical protein
MFKQVVYVSSSIDLDITKFVDESLPKIQAANNQLGITGVLLFSEGTFLQVIEGEPQAVNDLYGSIIRDGRHKQVIKLLERDAGQRSFPDWAMGWRRIAREHPLAKELQDLGDMSGVRKRAEGADGSIMTLIESYFSVNRD